MSEIITRTAGDMPIITFEVRGTPMPKGSTTRMPHGATIPAGTAESRRRMEQWRMDIRHAARDAMGDRPMMTVPVRLMCEIALPVPKSMPKRYQGWKPHTTKPDIDKLLRMLSDALTGIVWADDSQVCVSAINKVYAWDGITGASIQVEPISDEAAQRFAMQSKFLRERMRERA